MDAACRLLTRLDNVGRRVYNFDMASSTLTRRSLREAGRDIRERRLNMGHTPETLGHEIGISGRTIRRIEDGARPTVRTMFALATFFGFEVADQWPA